MDKFVVSEDRAQDAFLRHFLPVQTPLRAFLLSVMRDQSEADDLFQEVSVILWKKFDNYDASRGFAPWAIGIARLEVLKRRQAHARSRLVFSPEAIESLALAANEVADDADRRQSHLTGCLKKLPVREREIVEMRFEQRKRLSEVAATLVKSVAAVEMMMVRIRRGRRECVEKSLALEKGTTI